MRLKSAYQLRDNGRELRSSTYGQRDLLKDRLRYKGVRFVTTHLDISGQVLRSTATSVLVGLVKY